MPGNVTASTRTPIRQEADIVLACQRGRTLAEQAGMSSNEQVVVVIAISEITHNILRHAQSGDVQMRLLHENQRYGVEIMARDTGPGIPNIEKAFEDGYSTGEGLGLGLAGARRLMDEFEITSSVGHGTTVIMRKWKK